jgi:hypothetical protein
MDKPTIYWHSSETMPEVTDKSVKLLMGGSVFVKGRAWEETLNLYHQVYVENGLRVLRDDGYFVTVQTDSYIGGKVEPKNVKLCKHLLKFYDMLDVKVWRRRKADFYQVPFTMIYVWGKAGHKTKRPGAAGNSAYFQGVWDYPQVKGGVLNSWPVPLCELMVKSFTAAGDVVCDPFAGSAMMLGVAAKLGRVAVGYEINRELEGTIEANTTPKGLLAL